MIIHLVRHAEAVERSPQVLEEHRFLTRRGRKRFRQVSKSLAKLAIDPDLILTSPMVRAVQTADILAEALRYKGDIVVAPQLSSGFRPDALEPLLAEYAQAKEIALVGHEPDFGLVAQALLGTKTSCVLPKGGTLTVRRGAADEGEAVFLHLVTGGGKIVTSRGKALDRLQESGQ